MCSGKLPDFKINPKGKISEAFLKRDIHDFSSAVTFIGHLSYGRNSDRSRYELVLPEKRGTCSTKHALLAQLCIEHEVKEVKLYTGIYEMNESNTPGVGNVLKQYGLKAIPEAHCYLKHKEKRYDFTMPDTKGAPITAFMAEEQITPSQIGSYKLDFHREYLSVWLREQGLSRKLTADRLWEIREECIRDLSCGVR
ncbi:hypothetical protein JSY36_05175 [Bacillus sp. H-16]|uniref:hypothetical protein n=1 Tax=Alteribacter salitolerans TaxID=2912333 RepID=UPI001964C778|nr:hypothetical protein [Alteribacter salitolerans]MBM7095145.1 hypothetical protein [Alteribacter salitolerans]